MIEERIISSRIDHRFAGLTVLDFLVRRFTYRDRQGWLARIAAGEIRRNGATASPDELLREGDELSYHPGDLPEPEVDPAWSVAYEDPFMYLIEKSGDLPTHPAGPFFRHTLWYLLRKELGEIFLVNRLDRETSGLLIVAKDAKSAAALSRRKYTKEYLAWVHGDFSAAVDADGWLIPDAASAVRKKRRFVLEAAAGETASTRLEPVRTIGGYSLVRAIPRTGRLHQIRATLYSLGFPLVGDKLYGVDDSIYLKIRGDAITPADRAKLVLPRQALHSAALTFLPLGDAQEAIRIESPLPADMAELIR